MYALFFPAMKPSSTLRLYLLSPSKFQNKKNLKIKLESIQRLTPTRASRSIFSPPQKKHPAVADGVFPFPPSSLGMHQPRGGHVLRLHRVRRRGAGTIRIPGAGFRAQVAARTGRAARSGGGTRAAGVLSALLSPLPFSTAADSISKS